ncbi:MAG: 50S ribosomal protein L25, partial [Desulfobacteraceae bacterium]|nr:50S ribosomal protein L25 [Desulfobacteraceae bacterium]
MELIDLKAELRQETGKGVARTLRRNERVPAIVYGSK